MIQIDMEMPQNCYGCPMSNYEKGYCQITYSDIPMAEFGDVITSDFILDNCPLKESKESEGDDETKI